MNDPLAALAATRSAARASATDHTERIWLAASGLLEQWQAGNQAAVRLIGAGVSNFTARGSEPLELFDGDPCDRDRRRSDRAVDEIRGRFGDDAIAGGNGSDPG